MVDCYMSPELMHYILFAVHAFAKASSDVCFVRALVGPCVFIVPILWLH